MKKLILIFALVFTSPLFAQTNLQLKTVVHPTVQINDSWFVAGWNVTNIRQNATDNTNFMLGLGRKQKSWWIEFMAQRQDDTKRGHHWFVDFRTSFALSNKVNLYAEAAPFLDTKAVYNFLRLDVSVLPWLKIGAESENTFKNASTLGFGPCVGLGPLKLGPFKPSLVIAWQVRHNDPNFVRAYVVLPLVFRKLEK
jgi:hypothetical protein